MAQRKKGTQTSSFGTSGRINHDSSIFYNSKMFKNMPKEDKNVGISQKVPSKYINKIICSSSESMKELPDNSIHLMVTSPPYNVGKEYDEDFSLQEYLSFLKKVWKEVERVIIPGGRVCINVANLGRKPYLPLHSFIINDMINLGFLMRGEIIWNKAGSASPSTAWGSWLSASNPTLRDVHEYILVFSKSSYSRKKTEGKENSINKSNFMENTKSIWTFNAESAKRIGHPAPFPIELPLRLIELYSFRDEIILDPFIGSGQTAIAALKTDRCYIGYDIDKSYTKLARDRIKEFIIKEKSPQLF